MDVFHIIKKKEKISLLNYEKMMIKLLERSKIYLASDILIQLPLRVMIQ